MGRVEHDLTAEQWVALQMAWDGCAYCGVTDVVVQRECVLAISRAGRYTLDNVVPACRSCNASKCNDEVTGWLRRRRLDERTFLLRHVQIGAKYVDRSETISHDVHHVGDFTLVGDVASEDSCDSSPTANGRQQLGRLSIMNDTVDGNGHAIVRESTGDRAAQPPMYCRSRGRLGSEV